MPSVQVTLEIKTSGGSGDADLYVKRGEVPTPSNYDYMGYSGSNNETITVNSPASGNWFIMIRAYNAYSALTLVATYTAPTTLSNLTTPSIA